MPEGFKIELENVPKAAVVDFILLMHFHSCNFQGIKMSAVDISLGSVLKMSNR